MNRNAGRLPHILVLALAALLPLGAAIADEVKGTVNYKGKSATLKYAYLVSGPDSMDDKVIIREVILSQTDIAADIQACTTLSCSTNNLTDGLTVDLDAGPRLNYWVVLNKQMTQYSGTAAPDALNATLDEPGRLAGTLSITGSGSDGPKIEATFDVVLLKEFTAAH